MPLRDVCQPVAGRRTRCRHGCRRPRAHKVSPSTARSSSVTSSRSARPMTWRRTARRRRSPRPTSGRPSRRRAPVRRRPMPRARRPRPPTRGFRVTHDVRPAGQRAEPRRQRLPRATAHDHRGAERELLEVRQVFGHVPRHAAVAADHAAARLGPDQADPGWDRRPTGGVAASAGLIRRRPRGWRGGAGSPRRRSRRTRSRRSSRACGRSGGSAPGTARA